MKQTGLYIHIPFCASKCAYCDFYSFKATEELMDSYVTAAINELQKYRGIKADTLYIGGGTPTLLGAKRVERLLKAVSAFGPFSEATIEANPADDIYDTLSAAASGGINRLSLGVQTAAYNELQLLSRRHCNKDVQKTFAAARKAGIKNISADVMLAIPSQTAASLAETLSFVTALSPKHISAYLLKLEQGTPLYNMKNMLSLPNPDTAAELYLQCCNTLEDNGYKQYEISNFAKDGFYSRHNMNYWKCGEYIGIGPAAHGFLNGRRYYYKSDINEFINGGGPVFEDVGGTAEEYLMLGLRTADGISVEEYCNMALREQKNDIDDCGSSALDKDGLLKFAAELSKNGMATFENGVLKLTKSGFLVSNEIISRCLEY